MPWAALGPGRLHATITTGEIISKTAAADYTAELLPEHGALLARAKAHRLGPDGGPFTVADGYAACDLIDAVVNDAASLRGGRPTPETIDALSREHGRMFLDRSGIPHPW